MGKTFYLRIGIISLIIIINIIFNNVIILFISIFIIIIVVVADFKDLMSPFSGVLPSKTMETYNVNSTFSSFSYFNI